MKKFTTCPDYLKKLKKETLNEYLKMMNKHAKFHMSFILVY